jgi:hypothetical protein
MFLFRTTDAMVQISYRGIPVAAIISPERIMHHIHIENWTRTLF